MSWTAAVPIVGSTLGLVLLPGFLVALCLRFRGFAAVALAPAFSAAVVGAFAVAAGLAGIPWNPVVYGVSALIIAAAAYLITSWRTEKKRVKTTAWRDLWLPLAAAVLGGAMVLRRLMQLLGQPDHFAQNFDNVFHLNAIRYILETGNASSLTLGNLQGQSGFAAIYPAVWHTFASMTAQLTGTTVQVAENAINIVSSAVIWPLACVLLARTIFGKSPVITVVAGIVSAVQIAFPYLPLVWGPLFPNALSLALLPLALSVLIRLVRPVPDVEQPLARSWWIALLLAMAAITSAHMSALNALLVFSLPLLLAAWAAHVQSLLKARSSVPPASFVRFSLLSLFGLLLAALMWLFLRPTYNGWQPYTTTGGAIGEALTNGPMGEEVNWPVTILAVSGIIYLFHLKQHRWLVFSYAIAVALFAVAASIEQGPLRSFYTEVWYQDTFRLAAFLPIFATPLAAAGAWGLVTGFVQLASRFRSVGGLSTGVHKRAAGVGILVLTALLAGISYFGPVQGYTARSMWLYSFDESSMTVTPTEMDLLEDLENYVPEDAVVADNPWNGSSLAYAFGGRHVLTPHLFANNNADRVLLSEELATGDFTPEVCEAVEETGVEYVLDFGTRYLSDSPSVNEYPGVTDVEPVAGLELVASRGPDANLYRVTGCEQ